MGYLGTWSAPRRFMKANGLDPIVQIADELIRAWALPPKQNRPHGRCPSAWDAREVFACYGDIVF